MSGHLPRETVSLCRAFTALQKAGGDVTAFIGEWAQLLGVGRPSIWRRLRSGGALPPYRQATATASLRYSKGRREPLPAEMMIARRVERDPCPRCGVRSDIGCHHRPCNHLTGAIFGG